MKQSLHPYCCRKIILALLLPVAVVTFSVRLTFANDTQPGLVSAEFVFDTAPFPECHASSLVETERGLVVTWFGGQYEKHPNVGVWVSRNIKGKWTAPIEVANGVQADGTRFPCWNPVLFQPKTGPLLLFYKVGPSPSRWWGVLRTSTDHGETWTEGQKLSDGFLGPVKNKPIQLSNGDLLCPSSTETTDAISQWRVHFERTSDLGKTWTKVAPAIGTGDPINAIQPSILIHTDGKLQAVGRSRGGKVYETWSSDAGKTWSALSYTSLPNPNSGTDAVTLKDGRHLLVYNHTTKGRSPLNVAISTDGKAWHSVITLESQPGEYSYPAVIQGADGLVHVSYTWKRERVKHVVLDPSKLPKSP